MGARWLVGTIAMGATLLAAWLAGSPIDRTWASLARALVAGVAGQLAVAAWLAAGWSLEMRVFVRRLPSVMALLAIELAATVVVVAPFLLLWSLSGPSVVWFLVWGIALLVAGVFAWLAARLLLTLPALVLDGAPMPAAFASSWRRMRGRAAMALVFFVTFFLLLMPLEDAPYGARWAVLLNIGGAAALTAGFWALTMSPAARRPGSPVLPVPDKVVTTTDAPAGAVRLVKALDVDGVYTAAKHGRVWLDVPPVREVVEAAAASQVERLVVAPEEIAAFRRLGVSDRWLAVRSADTLSVDGTWYRAHTTGWHRVDPPLDPPSEVGAGRGTATGPPPGAT